jgi:hypothetical protein
MERSADETAGGERIAGPTERRPAKALDLEALKRMPLEALLYYVLVGPGAKHA